jgi:molecular chaperone DnaK
MATGKEQKITITSSTKLSEDEINAKIKEAEQYAEEDKKQKEAVETKNQAEGMIFEIERQMKDLGDKVNDQEKSAVEAAKSDLQSAIDANDVEGMKTKMEALTNAFYPISTRIYQEAQAQAGAQGGAQGFDPNNMGGAGFNPNMGGFGGQGGANNGPNNDGTVDADYEVVDED